MTEFYERLLGVKPVSQSNDMSIFFLGDLKIFIHYRYIPEAGELPPENHMAFLAGNVDETCKQLIDQGLSVEVPPQDFYWGRSAYLRDPDGHQIEITQNRNQSGEGESHVG
jgi:catechol 2,3-dioxygenase-like lactoylglutathione lyase family enzyme